jgi:hypothetical protein
LKKQTRLPNPLVLTERKREKTEINKIRDDGGKPLSRKCLEKGRMKSHVEGNTALMNGGLKEWKGNGEVLQSSCCRGSNCGLGCLSGK